MIQLENLTKVYYQGGQRTVVADGISVTLPGQTSIALMGRNGSGKSSLLRMIAGTMDPTEGRIISDGRISWPVGFAGNFHPDLSGAQNTRFIARVYGVDTDELIAYVADFSELGQHLDLPFGTYSSGMRSRLAFGVSMGIDFDTYLVDEVTSVGDASFRRKSANVFRERMASRGAVVVSHSIGTIRELCSAGAVIDKGKLQYFDDLEEAIALHNTNMGE